MKRINSLIVICCILTFIGGLLSINAEAQQKSSNNQKKTGKNKQRMNTNQEQTTPPVRTPQQLERIRQLIEEATRNGSVRVQVGVRDFSAQDELLRQLAPFQPELIVKFEVVPYLGLNVNAAALIYMRDSNLVVSIGGDMLLHTSTTGPPLRTPEELAYFQQLIEQALNSPNGLVRAIVGLRDSFVRDEILKQLAPFNLNIVTVYDQFLTLDLDVAALIYLRDSEIVKNIRPNRIGYLATQPSPRSPEELAYFQKAIDTALRNGTVRVTVGLNVSFTPEGNLTPEQRAAQRAAISLAQDELLRQLIPYQASLVTRFDIVPYLTLDADATALIFMRDSRLVLNVRENGVGTIYPTKRNRKKRQFVIYQ